MNMSLASLFLLALMFLPVWILVSLGHNIRRATTTGLPYVLSPVHELEPWAWVTTPILRWHCSEYLLKERGWPRWARFMIRDWHYEDKGRAHEEYGTTFLVVTPGGIVCYSVDQDVAVSVATQRKAFVKPPGRMKLLEPFGPNVVSTDGELWRFHIRTTLPAVGEGVQRLAWDETIRQADMLRGSWLATDACDVRSNMYQLSMNIACHVIFNHSVDWHQQQENEKLSPQGHTMSLLHALSELVLRLPFIILLPMWLLRLLPMEGARSARKAYSEVDRHMDELLAVERAALELDPKGQGGRRDNIMTAMLASSDPSVTGKASAGNSETRFTMKDIKGNMFVFLLAGYETTANTLIYSCVILALYPRIQAEVHDEIDAVYSKVDGSDRKKLSYPSDYQKLRCLIAFMYEILRVFPISLAFTRELASDHSLRVQAGKGRAAAGGEALLPRGSTVVVNVTGTHFAPTNWPSPHIIEPKRWLSSEPNSYDPLSPQSGDDEGEAPSIPGHRKGTFLSFGEGPRACLGRPLARVEFVAFFSTILQDHRIELEEGVDGVELERLIRCRGGGAPVSLNMTEVVRLRLVPRKGSA